MLPAGMNYLRKIQLETRDLMHNRHPGVIVSSAPPPHSTYPPGHLNLGSDDPLQFQMTPLPYSALPLIIAPQQKMCKVW